MNKEQVERLKKLATDGLSRYEICAEMRISDEECQALLRYCKLVAVSKKQRIQDMVDAKQNRHDIAEKLGCTETYIKQVLQTVAGSGVIAVERKEKKSLLDTITLPNVTIDGRDFTQFAKGYGLKAVEKNEHQTLYEIPERIEKRQALSLQRESLWLKGVPAKRLLSCYVNNTPDDESWGVQIH